MTYAILIETDNFESNFLAVIKPALQITSWTSEGGTLYSNAFTHGHVINVAVDGVALTQVTSSPSINEFWFDYENEKLYINITSPSTKTIIVTFEKFVSTFGFHWYRDPLDNTTRQVYYEPLIISAPTIKSSLDNTLFGYMPTSTSSITLSNTDKSFQEILYNASFYQKDINIYHVINDLDINNIKLLINGICSNLSFTILTTTINITDRIDLFDNEYRNVNNSFFNTTDFPNIQSDYIGRPIRRVFGRVDGLVTVNVDYNGDAPTTSNNRVRAICEGSLNAITRTVPASPSSTTTRTYVDDSAGLLIGDTAYINKTNDEYVIINNVDYTSNFIEHPALVLGAATTGDIVTRGTVSRVYIEQGGVSYTAFYERDYTESVVNNVIQITFRSTTESNIGISTLDSTELISCVAYGENNTETISGSPFGSNSNIYGNLTSPVAILYSILKNNLGLAENEFNTASFISIEASKSSEEIGFALPETGISNFPTYKNIITTIMRTNLLKLYLNNDNEWEIAKIEPLGSASKTAYDKDIFQDSFKYSLSYEDLKSDIIVTYKYKEDKDTSTQKSKTNTLAKYLHGVKKQETFSTYLLKDSSAQTLANKLSYIYGERRGIVSITVNNSFILQNISDVLNISLKDMIGYAYNNNEHTRSFSVLETSKSLTSSEFLLDDQKGIEDNSGSF